MINLKTYNSIPEIDTHIHLFDKDGSNPFYDGGKCIGFADVNDDVDYYELYKNYIKEHRINGALLATGKTPEEIIRIYNDFNCAGFGELKYKKESKKASYDHSYEWIREILEYNRGLNNSPVMIHCDFTENILPILADFPETNIIHCHCGCPDYTVFKEDVIKEEYLKSVSLSRQYPNYYYDLSWSVAQFLKDHPEYLKNNNPNKLLIGTDLNQNLEDTTRGPEKSAQSRLIQSSLRSVYGVCSDMNAMRIFRV